MTQRQITFALEYVKTGNATEAYRRAYPRSRAWKPNAVESSASSLLKSPKVSQRVAELRAKAERRGIGSLEEAMRRLWVIVRGRKSLPRDVVAAIDRVARLEGWDKPQRMDVTSGGERLRTEIVIVPRGAPDA